ncbi:unhealthy ribosome biogenesis protein 2 homolog isoform X3 [Clinocottus analis]|uniref:unhealthy ribosome biogenesis protein 2 homolog isoform X3 n=1 Tax=Clinocottus analis TaxID=304258 RepID=UPI0035C0BF46
MAAFYSGIHLKLKSPNTPWEDKLKLARFAWVSTQCLLPNKEQVLLDWCIHALTGRYNQKVEFSQNVLEGLWFYLDDLLHSRKLHSLLKQGKTISLRLNMAQLLLDRLQECARVGPENMACVSTILSVCQGLLSSPALSSVFTTKYELIVDLLAKLCSLACRELQQPLLTEPLMTESITCQDEVMNDCLQPQPTRDLDSSQIEQMIENSPNQLTFDANTSTPKPKEIIRSASLFEVLLQVLSCYLSVQRQQANPNRVFTLVTNQLIQPLILLRHLLTSGEFAPAHTHLRLRQQLSRDIRIKIDSILQLALFPSEHLTSYTEELLPSKEDSGKRGPGGAKGPLKPVSAILSKLSAQGYCEPSLHYTVKSNTLSLLFKFFLESYAKSRGSEEAHRMLCFYFLTSLVPALEVHLDGQSLSPAKADQPVSVSPGQTSPPLSLCSPESWSLALLALESLLSQALSADIYNVAADKIRHEEVQLKFYSALGQMLLNQAQPSIPAWYRCLKMLLSLNHLILEPELDQLLSSAWVNSKCMDARVQRARQLMVCSLLQTYTKLRQLPRLFSELLSVICQPALDDLQPLLLSESVSASLRTCLLDTPASQGLEICSLVLESIKRCILPGLTRGEGEQEQGKDKAGKELNELYVQILQTLHRLLTASWLSESDVCELEPAVQKLLRHLVEKSTTGRFNLLLLTIKEGLVTGKLRAGNYREVRSAAIITKLLSCCQLPEPCTKALWLIAPQIISAMVFLVKSSAQDVSLTLPFTVPTVASMTSLLRQGEGLITNPHHVILVLGALQLLPLDHLTPSVYQSAFLAVHEALFAIIQCHPQVMLNAAPSFLNVFYRLVASIMQEGRQRGDSDTDGDVYLQCSRLIERMYSHIAARAESFTTLSAFMVAQYVTELQKVTLRPDVKLHLTEGIYRILDLCGEQNIKFLMAGLQMGVREVFNELYSSYTHYHKAQRQGEDKYTV